jgi:YegS/Rv2252/BmrU family lipid kinase
MAFKKIVFVVNPCSGNGATGREWPRIEAAARARLGPAITSCLTSGPGDATRIVRSHLLDGADAIVCVGGDGTLNEVVNGFMDENGPLRKDIRLGFIPNGTGCDFVKTVPIPRKLEESLDTIEQGHACLIDLGRLRYGHRLGTAVTRYFHNIASFGLGGEVVARVNRKTKAFGPFVSFIWSTLIVVLFFGKKTIHLKIDSHYDKEIKIWNVAVANGQYHGGGMRVAPKAVIDDGLFHITIVGDFSMVEALKHLPKLYNGKIGDIKEVSFLTGKKVEAFSRQPVLLDVDGEQPGSLPVTIDIIPAALWMITKSPVSKG